MNSRTNPARKKGRYFYLKIDLTRLFPNIKLIKQFFRVDYLTLNEVEEEIYARGGLLGFHIHLILDYCLELVFHS